MKKATKIRERIDQIKKISKSAYVYTDECACIVKLIKELHKKIKKIPDDQIDDETYSQILNQLNELYKIINGFSQEEWQKVCFTLPIIKPFTLLTNTTNLLTESLEKINIKLNNEYQVLLENVTNELKTIYGILTDPSQQENLEVKKKLTEIEKYLSDIGQPLFETTTHSRRKRIKRINSKNKTSQGENDQITDKTSSNEIFPEEEDEINDFSNIDKYKIKRSDYHKEQRAIFHCNNYTIYKGKMKSTNEDVNIIDLDEDNYPIEKFQRLINVLITVKHPNLESFIGYVNSTPQYSIVTRKSGQKLSKILKKTKKTEKSEKSDTDDTDSIWKNGNRTYIAFNIALAMAYLHSINIIHRDLCTSNITIDENLNPKITNFVNSRFLPEDLGLLSFKPSMSSYFRAPELIVEENYDETVDVFSFGGILYELLTGKKPFVNLSNSQIEEEIRLNHRPALPEEISTDLRNLIESCWEQKKELRPSFSEIIDTMITNQISFPNDDEHVKQFYQSKMTKNDDLKNCLEMFKNITMAMNYSIEFQREIFRTRTFLHSYQFVLQNSSYATLNEIEDPDVIILLQNMYKSLCNLFVAIMYSNDNRWPTFAPNNPSTFIPLEIYANMEDIYIWMTELGFKVSKYEIVNSDLIIDLRRVYIYFKACSDEIPQMKERMKEIEDFLHDRNLEFEIAQSEINQQLKNIFKPFVDFYINRNDFKIIEELGNGISSYVYKAQRISTGEFVAIKEFKPKYLKSERASDYLRREISSLVNLHHKYLVDFVGFNNDEHENPWIITKIVNNGDLYSANKVGLIDSFEKTKIAFEIAEGMEYLHSKKVIHRDLKTLNVLLENITPKITDFGYARIDLNTMMTNQIGTRNYMSPEIILGENYSFATDVFSFALLLWELYAVKVPYSWTTKIEDEITNNAPLPYDSEISQDLLNLIEDAKKIDPSLRPSFTQIIKRMIDQKIHFSGADLGKVDEFYKMKENERKELNV